MTSTTTTTIMDLRVKTWPSIQGWNRESKSSGTELKNGEAKQAGGRGEGGGGKESEPEAIHDSQVTLHEGKCGGGDGGGGANAEAVAVADADAAANTAAARAARANDVVNDLTEFLFDLFDAELDDG